MDDLIFLSIFCTCGFNSSVGFLHFHLIKVYDLDLEIENYGENSFLKLWMDSNDVRKIQIDFYSNLNAHCL